MKYNGFSIRSVEYITDAYCNCNSKLIEVSNGVLSRALYCPKCENVYVLKKIKLTKKKITKEFLIQCRNETKNSQK